MSVLLAITKDRKVHEVPLEKGTADELGDQFTTLSDEYVVDKEEVPYEPAYTPQANEIMVLDYELPAPLDKITRALPSGIPKLDPKQLETAPPVALVYVRTGTSPTFCFQAITKQNLLRPKTAVLFGKGDFKFNKQTGIIPTGRLDAIYEGGQLFFRSENIVRRFLDMERFFKEATDRELGTFFEEDSMFIVEDIDAVREAAGRVLRRKIARLLSEEATFDLPSIRSAVEEAELSIEFKRNKVVVPSEKKELKQLVDLLSHAYVRSLLDATKVYLASSMRPVSKVSAEA